MSADLNDPDYAPVELQLNDNQQGIVHKRLVLKPGRKRLCPRKEEENSGTQEENKNQVSAQTSASSKQESCEEAKRTTRAQAK